MMRLFTFRPILIFVLALLAGCGGAQRTEDIRGTVRFRGEPKDAQLTVNETHLGPIGMFEESGVRLRPGKQRVEVSKEDYFTEYRLVDVQADKLVELDIKLREIP